MKYPPNVAPDIMIRNLRFDARLSGNARWYVRGDPVPTAFLSALSTVFPDGERFFIDSVREWRATAPAKLQGDIDRFIKQEALHTREHAAFNTQVHASGYDTRQAAAQAKRELDRIGAKSALRRLGLTVTLEHFTALFAHQLLAAPQHLANIPDTIAQMWRWHAIEEIEHKAVAFDTFLHATREWSPARRYAFRLLAMLETSWLFAKTISLNMRCFYRQDGLRGFGMVCRTLKHLVGRGGLVRAMGPGWLDWFRPGFHPWQLDDSKLAATAALEFAS